MRGDAQILIYINIKRALAAGCPFWISENGVILSEGMGTDDGPEKVIPLEFFDVVVERKNGLGVLWENGRLIQETPQWMLKAKAPAGKGGKGGHQKAAPRLKVEKEMDYGYP
jgi:2'-phosphotransferase